MKYITYIIYNEDYNKYYIGQTNNLEKRLKQHCEGKGGWTKRYKNWVLVYKNDHTNRSFAMKEEKLIKSLKNKKRIKEYIAGWWSSTM